MARKKLGTPGGPASLLTRCRVPEHSFEKASLVWSQSYIESSPEEKDEGVLVDDKLNVTQQCICSPEGQPYPGLHHKKSGQKVEGGDSPPLLCSLETPPGALHPAQHKRVRELLERAQRRARKMIRGLEQLN